MQQYLICYQEHWCSTLNLLQKVYKAVQLMQKALKKYICKEIMSKQDWLAFWGIKREFTKGLKYSPSG